MHFGIDGDVMLWKVSYDAASYQQGYMFFDALYNKYINYLRGYFKKMSDVTVYITSDDKSNFRYSLPSETPYKSNRANRKVPEVFHDLKNYVHERGAIMAYGREADDLIAIQATKERENFVIVSNDKDYRQVPDCWHWETQEDQTPYFVTNPGFLFRKRYKDDKSKIFGTGNKFFYFQILAGDPGDGVPGLRGVGHVKAFEMLDSATNETEMWTRVVEAYEGKGSSEEVAIQNARLLWLQRRPDDLWVPPTNDREPLTGKNG
jgi:5'-3' exonuclease